MVVEKAKSYFQYEVRGTFLNLYARRDLFPNHCAFSLKRDAKDVLDFLTQVPFEDGLESSVSAAIKKCFDVQRYFDPETKFIVQDIHSETTVSAVYKLPEKTFIRCLKKNK